MKIMQTATFRFSFKDIKSKDESYKTLKEFLKINGWINQNEEKLIPLLDYHSEPSGICEVVLAKKDIEEEDFLDSIDELFESLIQNEEISFVSTYKKDATAKIIENNAGKYLNRQIVQLSEAAEDDEIFVFIRQ